MGHPGKIIRAFLSVLGIIVFLAGAASQGVAAPPPPHPPLDITRITPSGTDVPIGREILFQFDRSVVPLGAMARKASEIPITITPSLECQWRWLNPKTLACQLGETSALKPATSYNIVVNPGIRALDGATLEKPVEVQFTTVRPKVTNVWFRTWSGPGMPVIRLSFNQPVFKESLIQHLYFASPGEATAVTGISVSKDPDVKDEPLKKEGVPGNIARRVWLVAPETDLPLGAKITLRIVPGIISFLGPEKGIERRVLASFSTFPAFTFEGVECTDNRGKTVQIAPNDPDPLENQCNPLRQAALLFSSPVNTIEVKECLTFMPSLSGDRVDYDPWAGRTGYTNLSYPHKEKQTYKVWIPELLKAFRKYSIKSSENLLKDVFGRPLEDPISMAFMTDHRLPNFVLTHRQAVLEKGVDSRVPLVVTNLEKVDISYDRLTVHGKEAGQKQTLQMPKVEDIAFKIPLETREMLQKKSGVVQGTVQTHPTVKKSPWERWFMAQVTPFQVHAKIGHYNTLVWVTELATGMPVKGARVSLYRSTYNALPETPSPLCHGITDSNGILMMAGTGTFDPHLTTLMAYGMKKPHFFLRVQKREDMAMLPLDGPFRVDTYRASGNTLWPDMRQRYGHMHAWGTTAQGVYRAGDTIQYKLYVRDQDNESFVPPPLSGYHLTVLDPMGKKIHEREDLTLNRFGAAHGEFHVPKTGAVGWYRFELTANFAKWSRQPMRVLVSDFTPSPFKVSTELNGQFFEAGKEVDIITRARLHGGGPYGNARNRITALVRSGTLIPKSDAFRNFRFDTTLPKAPPEETVFQSEGKLNHQGDADSRFTLPEGKILYGKLVAESAVQDDRGKSITGRASASYTARNRYVGLRPVDWVMTEAQSAPVELLVVDDQGIPVKDVPITVILSRRVTKAARVKGPGNAYIPRYTHHWVEVDRQETVSGLEPVPCSLTPKHPGPHRVIATVRDTMGREHSSQVMQWVLGKGEVVWQEGPDNRLEIIPEKNRYRVGDRARYLVKNPFPGASALVTMERYGILRHWVQKLEGSTPTIEFEVAQDEAPGFYLSVTVISPRVEQPPLKPGDVDLGKPAFRMGYVKTAVFDPDTEIPVVVEPAHEIYKPGDKVTVKLKAMVKKGQETPPVEMAVAVLDESVFQLIAQGSDYFDPYKGFNTLDGLDMENFSLLMGLVGRQKFEKKGADQGGGGGAHISLRSVFKFVSYWNPAIIADEKGEAAISFKAPDNLTGWRILAMAVTPFNRMGLGQGRISVNQPTEIRPVMPNQVVEGDEFEAGFSIMNRTKEKRRLKVTVTAQGPIKTPITMPAHADALKHSFEISLSPFERQTVWVPIHTVQTGRIAFTAKAWDKEDGDGLTHTLPVNKRYFLETAALYGSSNRPSVTETIAFPKEMRTDAGGIAVQVSPTVLGNLEGAFQYLKAYPYACWEQILTKGVMASHYIGLKEYLPSGFSWPESPQLVAETLRRAADFQAPGGGMTYYVPEDQYASPYLSAYTALAFTWLREAGFSIPETVLERLHIYLDTLLRRNTLPDFYTRGMASTVRAVALAALAKEGKLKRSDLTRYQPRVKEMSLFGKAHFLMAALEISGTHKLRSRLLKMILAHSNESAGKIVFSETIDHGFSRILASPLRTNGAILSALVTYAATTKGKKEIRDVPMKLVRFITQARKKQDHWENTQANIFCMNGLVNYAREYEARAPDFNVRALFEDNILGQARFTDVRDEAVTFSRPVTERDPGKTARIQLEKAGQGRLYYAARLSYAPLGEGSKPVNAGIEIRREYSLLKDNKWRLLQNPIRLKRGDLVRIDLFLSLPAARNFVVVDDPVPGGLEPVNRDLATASRVDADPESYVRAEGSWWFRQRDWFSYGVSRWSFYHRELRHNAARFYSEYLPAGNYHLSYTGQVIASGVFTILPVHAEEMYDPDVFGRGVMDRLKVEMPKKRSQ